ncbi:MFS transporter [Paenibacillus macerans]|uniref:MFS transporter n=1 Tax=Paenibacillus macerans TaxID=44252 RepID=UPI00203F41E6|nr:MFS transporter [Paenibacillus macerans]MCM3701700.1 MFS transporter [Paenibacillus macerans]
MKPLSRNLVGILLSMSLTGLTQTMVATAMPSIAADLGGLSLYSWVFGAYLLANSAPMLLYGKLADEMGWRIVLLGGVGLFLIGTALAGGSQSMGGLVAFRTIQGVGAGLLSTSVLAAVGALFEGERRARLFGYLGSVQVLANLLGPLLGGWITDSFGWRWCFYAVLPLGLIAALISIGGFRSKENIPVQRLKSLDWPAFAALSAGPAVFLWGLQEWRTVPSVWWLWLVIMASAFVFFWRSLAAQTVRPSPILPPIVFRHTVLRNVLIGAFLAGFVQNASISYIPYVAHTVFGGSAARAGVILIPVVFGAGISGIIGGRLAGTWRYLKISTLGWFVNAAGFFLLAILLAGSDQMLIMLASLLIGLGIGFLLPSLLVEAQDAMGPTLRGMAGGIIQMSRNLGGSVGIPLVGVWLPSVEGMYSLSASASLLYTLAAVACLSIFAGWAMDRYGRRNDEKGIEAKGN